MCSSAFDIKVRATTHCQLSSAVLGARTRLVVTQVDKAEKLNIRKLGISAFTMHDIDRHGIGRVQPARPSTSFRSHTSWSLARLLSLFR